MPALDLEPEPKLVECRSRSGNKKFQLHNTACSLVTQALGSRDSNGASTEEARLGQR